MKRVIENVLEQMAEKCKKDGIFVGDEFTKLLDDELPPEILLQHLNVDASPDSSSDREKEILNKLGIQRIEIAGFPPSEIEAVVNYMLKNLPLRIEKYNMEVVKDEENKIFLSYDIEDGKMQIHTEGILKEINQEIADLIQQRFDINLSDYGIKIVDSDQDVSMKIKGDDDE
jgi:hypothetical protein